MSQAKSQTGVIDWVRSEMRWCEGKCLLALWVALPLLLHCPGAETQGTILHDKMKKTVAISRAVKQRGGDGSGKRSPLLDLVNLKNQSLAYKEWFASLRPEDYTQGHW